VTTPAADIQDAIEFCADNIAELSYANVVSIKTRMTAWIAELFGAPTSTTAIFTNVESAGQRRVLDWWAFNIQANEAIEGPLPGDASIGSTCGVIDVVSRTLCAVQAAQDAGAITQAQEDDVVAAFNTEWT
jgi:hypothetical protein